MKLPPIGDVLKLVFLQPMSDQQQRYEIWKPFLLAIVLAIGMVIGTQVDDELPESRVISNQQKVDSWDKLINTIGFIRSRYGGELESDSLTNEAIKLLMANLDPHSYYSSGVENQYIKERLNGSYEGIGIEYEVIDDTISLINIIPGGPAEKSGLKTGDQILAINGHDISGKGLEQMEMYEIWKGTGKKYEVVLSTLEDKSISRVTLEKAMINLPSVPAGFLLQDSIGYIKIVRFSNNTYRDFMERLEHLVDLGVKDVIIDVRNNPGGSLQEVIKVLNQFIPDKDQLLVYMDGRHIKRTEYKTTGNPFFRFGHLAVLVNEHSASASEVLSGVLQDLGIATVIGRRTYGKALVQEMYDIGEDASINLTVGKYYLPSGRYIQKTYEDRNAYEGELQFRFEHGEMFEVDSIRLDSTTMVKDMHGVLRPQGEGVVPDIFVPADKFWYGDTWKMNQKTFSIDAFKYYRGHQSKVKSMINGEVVDHQALLDIARSRISENSVLDSLWTNPVYRPLVEKAYVHTLIKYAGSDETEYLWSVQHDEMVDVAIRYIEGGDLYPNIR